MSSARLLVKSLLYCALLCCMAPSLWGAEILFVSTDPTTVSTNNDGFIGDFFKAMGHTVTYIGDSENQATTRAAASAADLVYISESVSSGGIKNEITAIQTPMIVSEPYAWDEMGLTSNSGGDELAADTTITITMPDHFLAAGFTGSVEVLTSLQGSLGEAKFPKGWTDGDGKIIAQATLADGVLYDMICVYEKEDELAQDPADGSPAIAADIRIGFFLHQNNQDIMTDEAYTLLAAAVNYALSATAQARVPQPICFDEHASADSLSWTAGEGAVSHNVYLGTTPELTEADLVSSEQAGTTYTPAETLVPGQTYYWRVDEVAGNGTVTTGMTWTFSIALLQASSPEVADGTVYVDLDPAFSWVAGFGSVSHNVYFGNNIDAVTAATTDSPEFQGNQSEATFAPAGLEKGYSYFWRVDEITADDTVYTGDVWTFSTIPNIPIYDANLVGWWKLDDDGVAIATDYSGFDHHGTMLGELTWSYDGADGDALEFPGNSGNFVELQPGLITTVQGTLTMWMQGPSQEYLESIENANDRRLMAFNGAHENGGSGFGSAQEVTLGCHTNGKARFFIEGGDLGDINLYGDTLNDGVWHHVAVTWDIDGDVILYSDGEESASTEHTGMDFPLDAVMRLGTNGKSSRLWKGLLDDVRIYDYALTPEEVQVTMLGDPRLAGSPSPSHHANASVDLTQLSWTAGENAFYHDVYFGTDHNSVTQANITSGDGTYQGRLDAETLTYDLPETLSYGQTYYWRVDEVNEGEAISKGRVWIFEVSNNVVVDDFESYDDETNQPYLTWLDGWDEDYGNGTGSQTGYDSAPYMETDDYVSASQSLPFLYDNTGDDRDEYSQLDRIWDEAQDWTVDDIYALQVSLKGRPMAWSEDNGSFTITSEGEDIYNYSDEFRLVYKTLKGDGSIVARIDSIEGVDPWSLAGVMIRSGLDPADKFLMVCETAENGIRFRKRATANISVVTDSELLDEENTSVTEDQLAQMQEQITLNAPYWIKLERSGHVFSGYTSPDGSTWTPMAWGEHTVAMSTNTVYIGLAVCSHSSGVFSTAEISNVSLTGDISGDWEIEHIGVDEDNSPEPMYVIVEDASGSSAKVTHPDGDSATLLEDWTAWEIPMTDLAGVDLASVKSLHIGVGNNQSPTEGGTGLMLLDDVLLLRQEP